MNNQKSFTIIRELEGSFSSKVELIKDTNNKLWVLKTVPKNDAEEIYNEKYFLKTLSDNKLNPICIWNLDSLEPNQLIIEYIENSNTVGKTINSNAYNLLGKEVKKMHGIKYDKIFKINSSNQKVEVNWNDFILKELEKGLKRIETKKINFTNLEINQITTTINNLSKIPLFEISLLHCDLHFNNALFTDTENPKIFLFDKGSSIISGHPYYDLAIAVIEFPSLFGLEKSTSNSQELFLSFVDGYDLNFWEHDRELLLDYVLLRSIQRLGSPFNPYLEDLIKSILKYKN